MTATAPSRPTKRIGFGSTLSSWDLKLSPYLYISPFFILFAVVGIFPIVFTAVISFQEWDLVRNTGTFVGFEQYAWILSQPQFWVALRNTFSIFLLSSVPQLIVAVFIAAMLDQNIRAKTFWRMGVLLPYVVAPVAVSMIFGRLFADQYGLVNSLLGLVGVDPVAWHSNTFASHIAISSMVTFRWTGYNALIFLAAMQAVPRELYEAAIIDGASRARQFFSVTVPQIRATIIFVVITSTLGGLQIFDEPRMFDAQGLGGADRQWMTTVLYLYDVAWGNQKNFGRAAAIAWMLFLLILVIGLINFFVTQRISSSGTKTGKKKRRRGLADLERAQVAPAPMAGAATPISLAVDASAPSQIDSKTDGSQS